MLLIFVILVCYCFLLLQICTLCTVLQNKIYILRRFMDKSLILNDIKNHYGFKTKEDFANFLGIAPTTLSSWARRNSFDIDLVYAKCTEIDANWLITGKGEMLKKEGNQNNSLQEERIPYHLEKTSPINDSVDYWKTEYFNLSQKYQKLQEEHTKLLNQNLQEALDALSNQNRKSNTDDESSVA
ncbi:hypothetical protein FM120_31330 [Sphingobacterium faecium PCAi_F2.5]|nr:hypothetical protein FM120_31330 [Sphingobacterium faecium PCAi_F2.5]